jgi:hypothetical protein
MCTLTFIPKPQGYLLGMNRDERLTRELALPPVPITTSSLSAVYPRETGGGTWIGSNSAGITFALLNQNPGPQSQAKERSRGEIIPALLASSRFPGAMRRFQHVDLGGIVAFSAGRYFSLGADHQPETHCSFCASGGITATGFLPAFLTRWRERCVAARAMKHGAGAMLVLSNGCADFTLRTRQYADRLASACIGPTQLPSATQKRRSPAANSPCVIMPDTLARRWGALIPKSILSRTYESLLPVKKYLA